MFIRVFSHLIRSPCLCVCVQLWRYDNKLLFSIALGCVCVSVVTFIYRENIGCVYYYFVFYWKSKVYIKCVNGLRLFGGGTLSQVHKRVSIENVKYAYSRYGTTWYYIDDDNSVEQQQQLFASICMCVYAVVLLPRWNENTATGTCPEFSTIVLLLMIALSIVWMWPIYIDAMRWRVCVGGWVQNNCTTRWKRQLEYFGEWSNHRKGRQTTNVTRWNILLACEPLILQRIVFIPSYVALRIRASRTPDGYKIEISNIRKMFKKYDAMVLVNEDVRYRVHRTVE